MTGYSSETIARPVTADQFAEAKGKILVKHQGELKTVQESIAPLKIEATRIKTETETMLKERQQVIKDATSELQKILTGVEEKIQIKQSKLNKLVEGIKTKLFELGSMFIEFNKQKQDFEQEKTKTVQEKQETSNGKEMNEKENKTLLTGQNQLKEDRIVFEKEVQEENESLENQRIVLESKDNSQDLREVNLNALEIKINAATIDYTRIKQEALTLQTSSKIDAVQKTQFKTDRTVLNKEIEQNKTLHIELVEKETALDVRSGAVAYREANSRKREKLVKQAEKHIAVKQKEVGNGSDKSNTGN